MAEYIKKADVVKLCENYSEYCFDNCDFLGASDFERLQKDIEQLPTADVVEVKHGEWKLMGTEKFMDDSCASKFFCSKCLREVGVCHDHESDKYEFAKTMYPYCHCGAKMDVSKMEITTERKDT